MSLRLIKELHAILMKNVRGAEKTPGEFKKNRQEYYDRLDLQQQFEITYPSAANLVAIFEDLKILSQGTRPL